MLGIWGDLQMKYLLIGMALAVGFGGTAMAADMPLKAPVPVYTWTGFYVGADIGGYGAGQTASTNPFPSPGFGAPAILGFGIPGFGNLPTAHDLGQPGALAAIHGGYNWQVSNWVFGLEADIDLIRRNASDIETVFETFAPGPAFTMQLTATNQWLASARGRLGWTSGSWLFYATGGAAWTSSSYSATATGLVAGPVALPGVVAGTSFSENKTGLVVGGGLEYMLSPNWIVRAEYLHYDFTGASGTLPLLVAGPGGCAPGACNWAVSTSNLRLDSGRLGLSYKF
jgi:outer membrane immunogenic protein